MVVAAVAVGASGVYRVNRRLIYAVGDGRVSFTSTGAAVRVISQELCELPLLRGFDDVAVLGALADRFVQREFKPDDVMSPSPEGRGLPIGLPVVSGG